MKITPSVRNLKELTRYISPAEIEKIRFKRFNEPKIQETPNLCDEFFRTDELFRRGEDVYDTSYYHYGTDDVPRHIHDMKTLDLSHYASQFQAETETELPPHITLLRTGKKFYIEKLNHIAPYSQVGNIVSQAMEKGFGLRETLNILDCATLDLKYDDRLAKKGFNLLKLGYPLEMVVEKMQASLLRNNKGTTSFVPELFDFLVDYPEFKKLFVIKNAFKNEVFDAVGARRFREVYETCKTKEEAVELAKSCQTAFGKELADFTSSEQIDLALEMYKKYEKWNAIHSMIMRKISNKPDRIQRVYSLIDEGIHPVDILNDLKSNFV